MTEKTHKTMQESESVLGFLLGRVILTFVFYVVLTPIAWLARLLGKQWMPLEADSTQVSYWNQRNRKPTPAADFEKQS